MNRDQLQQRVQDITVWKRGSQRAPHKPLLILYALAKCGRGEPRAIPYADVDRDLAELLKEFGPARKSVHPEYPFWRLQNDGIWQLSNADDVQPRAGSTDAKKSELLKYDVSGGFTEAIYDLLRGDQQLVADVAQTVLEQHFPDGVHDDILEAVGLDLQSDTVTRRRRDPKFRVRVLTAYEYRCAVCGFDVRLGGRELGIESAPIKWHQAGGPDIESNGLALCVLHHKLFDRGTYTVSLDRDVQVSQRVHGTRGFREWLLDYHGKPLRRPQSKTYDPNDEFIAWHRKEVFHGPARD